MALFVVFVTICQFCISIVGLTDGYNALSESNKARVCSLSERSSLTKADNTCGNKVYLESAEELRGIISRSPKEYQIVYSYNPVCKSDACISMGTFISICERYNAEPIILCRYLDDIILEQGLSDPNVCVYAMDSEKYNTRFVF